MKSCKIRNCFAVLVCIVVIVISFYLILLEKSTKANKMKHYLLSYKYLRRPAKYCSRMQRLNKLYLLVLVVSRLTNQHERNVLRKTWASVTEVDGLAVGWVFVLGKGYTKNFTEQNIMKESREHGDILQFDFLDTYYNLTLKSVNAFKFVLNNCDNVQFVMKTDDDVIVNVEGLIPLLIKQDHNMLYMGKTNINSNVIRDKKNKWYISEKFYPTSTLPPYNVGPGYIFSIPALQKTISACTKSEDFPMEDVFIGMCAVNAKVTPLLSLRFRLHIEINLKYHCVFEYFVVIHGILEAQRTNFWKQSRTICTNKQSESVIEHIYKKMKLMTY